MPVRTSPRTTVVLLMVMSALVGAGVLAGHLHRQTPARVSTSLSRFTIQGTITSENGSPDCSSGPNTVKAGAPVTILDVTGAVLATTSLGAGQSGGSGACHWDYSVSVPVTDSYQVQVAGIPPVTVARSALAGGRFTEQDPVPSSGGSPLDSGI